MRRAIALLLLLTACSGDAAVPTAESEAPPVTTEAAPAPSSTFAPPSSAPVQTPPPAATTAGPVSTTRTPPAMPTSEPPREDLHGDWFAVSVTASLPDGFAAALREVPGVTTVSEVWVGNARVVQTRNAEGEVVDRTRGRFVIPVELHALDPNTHGAFAPRDVAAVLEGLGPGEVLLGASSARFRGLGAGATVTLEDGTVLAISGVVPDEWVGAAEMVTTSPDPVTLGADRPRYAVVRFDGTRDELAAAAQALTEKTVNVRADGEGTVTAFRHAAAVQPQIQIKERFGEFSYRALRNGRVEIDPDWVDANIVTVDLPLIGAIRCHKDFAALLRKVMEELEAGGNGGIISPSSETGCYKPRFIAGRRDLSRHAWGIAADINWGNDHDGPQSPVAPPLLEAMASAGITSGHAWTDPDPGHFEWIGDSPG